MVISYIKPMYSSNSWKLKTQGYYLHNACQLSFHRCSIPADKCETYWAGDYEKIAVDFFDAQLLYRFILRPFWLKPKKHGLMWWCSHARGDWCDGAAMIEAIDVMVQPCSRRLMWCAAMLEAIDVMVQPSLYSRPLFRAGLRRRVFFFLGGF